MTLPKDIDPLLPGQIVGDRYEIVRMLGRGNLGPLFEARDLGPPAPLTDAAGEARDRASASDPSSGHGRVLLKVLGLELGFPGELLPWMPEKTWETFRAQVRRAVNRVVPVVHPALCPILDHGFIEVRKDAPPPPPEASPAEPSPAMPASADAPAPPSSSSDEKNSNIDNSNNITNTNKEAVSSEIDIKGEPIKNSQAGVSGQPTDSGQGHLADPSEPSDPGPPGVPAAKAPSSGPEAQASPSAAAANAPPPIALPAYHLRAAYLVMPFLDGEDLLTRVKREGPLPLEKAMTLFIPLLEGLELAHKQKIIHGELRPENILILDGDGPEPRLVLTDLAGRRLMQMLTDEARSRCTVVPGPARPDVLRRARYVSPENARGLPLDPSHDIYQLGLSLVEVVSGQPAVRGQNLTELQGQVMRFGPVLPPIVEEHAPLLGVMRKAIHRDCTLRYAHASAFAADLRAVLDGETPVPLLTRRQTPEDRSRENGPRLSGIDWVIFVLGLTSPWLGQGWSRPGIGLLALCIWFVVVKPTWAGLAPTYLTIGLILNLIVMMILAIL